MKMALISALLFLGSFQVSALGRNKATFELQERYLDPNQYGEFDQYIDCQSLNYKYTSCYVGGLPEFVALVREFSYSACHEGQTWGLDRGYLWVTNGCRGKFGISRFGHPTRVFCGSRNFRLNRCTFGRPLRDVRILQQTSRNACIQGSSWGWDPRGIWTDKGCAAEFNARFK